MRTSALHTVCDGVTGVACKQETKTDLFGDQFIFETTLHVRLVAMGTHVHCNSAMSAFSALHLLRSYNHLLGPTGK
jgi:hypothetical protein